MAILRLLMPVLLALLAGVAALIALPHSPGDVRDVVLAAGPLAPVVLLGAWSVLTPAMFPGTLLAASGGLVFGAEAGALLAVAGASLGGVCAFALARGVMRVPLEARLGNRFHAIRHTLVTRGFTAILAARLAPGAPVGVLHYAAGVSQVRFRDFALAIGAGALLRTAPYAVLGAGVGTGSLVTLAIGVVSAIVALSLSVPIGLRLRREAAAASPA